MYATRANDIAERPASSRRRWRAVALLIVATVTAPTVEVLSTEASPATDQYAVTLAGSTWSSVKDVDGVISA